MVRASSWSRRWWICSRATPEGGTTALHLALLRPLLAEVEAAFEREDTAAHEAWTSGLLTAGVAGFWNAKETTA